jgi:mannose-1-phosphate guanylyltransferase
MKALILAGGYGTRLQHLTKDVPKCLMPINGIPIIEMWINKLVHIGINEIYINTHYLHEKVEDYVSKSKYKKIITLLHEPVLLGTGGTLINNIALFLNDDCFLIHADNFYTGTLVEFLDSHNNRNTSCKMTMLTFITDKPEQCGIVSIKDNIVIDFKEKNPSAIGNIANGAVYILTAALLNLLKSYDLLNYNDFSEQIIPKMVGEIWNYTTMDSFIDIGTVENYNKVKSIKF